MSVPLYRKLAAEQYKDAELEHSSIKHEGTNILSVQLYCKLGAEQNKDAELEHSSIQAYAKFIGSISMAEGRA
jgi:hypothetical protein